MVIAIRSTAIGAFPSRAEAEQAVCGLLEAALWTGAIFRSLIGVEIPTDEVRYYEEPLLEGRTLVMVRAGDRYPEAMDVLHRCGGKYMAAF